jgi:hypothetical protein
MKTRFVRRAASPKYLFHGVKNWLGRQDLNLGMAESKIAAGHDGDGERI